MSDPRKLAKRFIELSERNLNVTAKTLGVCARELLAALDREAAANSARISAVANEHQWQVRADAAESEAHTWQKMRNVDVAEATKRADALEAALRDLAEEALRSVGLIDGSNLRYEVGKAREALAAVELLGRLGEK